MYGEFLWRISARIVPSYEFKLSLCIHTKPDFDNTHHNRLNLGLMKFLNKDILMINLTLKKYPFKLK